MAKITAAERKRVASFRAGLIIESIIQGGWWPEDLEREYGADGLQAIADEISKIAEQLTEKGRRTA
jgi:hypothetical protein